MSTLCAVYPEMCGVPRSGLERREQHIGTGHAEGVGAGEQDIDARLLVQGGRGEIQSGGREERPRSIADEELEHEGTGRDRCRDREVLVKHVAPGPNASVMAAVIAPGGKGTGSPFTGLVVPVCSAKVPSLPIWSARVQLEKPDSKPPLTISPAKAVRGERAT